MQRNSYLTLLVPGVGWGMGGARHIQGGFFDCSALKMTKYKEKLKYQNCSANCSPKKF